MEVENPTQEATESQVETQVESTPVETTNEAQPVDWDNALAKAFESEPEAEAKQKDDAPETEGDPAAPFPSDSETATEETQASQDAPEDDTDEEAVLKDVTSEENRLTPLTRKKRDEVVKAVIDPLRDPDVPISEAREALRQFHPTRAVELEQQIVNQSAKDYPDDWMQALLGMEGVTVERVKEALSIVENLPKQEQADDTKDIPEYLTDLYGEDWKDPQNDSRLLDEDAKLAKLYRKTLDIENRYKSGETELKSKLDANEKELAELRKVSDEIKQRQEQEAQAAIEDTFNRTVDKYRSDIEQAVISTVTTDFQLAPLESDTDTVKGVKNSIKAHFEPVYGQVSDFELFVQNEFQHKDKVAEISRRVATLHSQAAQLKAQKKDSDAQSLYDRADDEKKALRVLSKQAAKQFIETPRIKAQMALLEENANLKRQLSATGRTEIVGQSAINANPNAWLEEAKESGDIWNGIGNKLSSIAQR